MALPALPTQGQNPWFGPRTEWDNAVMGELEGRLSVSFRNAVEGVVQLPVPASDSEDNTATLQAAVDALPEGGGEVRLAVGARYRVNGVILLRSGIHINLNSATIFKDSLYDTHLLFLVVGEEDSTGYGSGAVGIKISNGTIEGDIGGSPRVGVGMEFHHVDSIEAVGVRWLNAQNGHLMDLLGCREIDIHDCIVEGNRSGTVYNEAFQMDSSCYQSSSAKSYHALSSYDGLATKNLRIYRCQFLAGGWDIPIPAGNHVAVAEDSRGWHEGFLFENNIIEGSSLQAQHGTHFGLLHFISTRNIVIRNNTVRYTGAAGLTGPFSFLRVSGATEVISLATVSSATPSTVSPSPARGVENVVVEGNILEGMANVPFQSNIGLIHLLANAPSRIEDVQVKNNTVRDSKVQVLRAISSGVAYPGVYVLDNRISYSGSPDTMLLSGVSFVASGNFVDCSAGGYVFFINSGSRGKILGNTLAGGRPFRIAGSDGSIVANNQFEPANYAVVGLASDGTESQGNVIHSNIWESSGASNSLEIHPQASGTRVYANDFTVGGFLDTGVDTSTTAGNRTGV